jgi:hypothetical protein
MTEAAHAVADAMCEAQTIIDEHVIGSLYTPQQVVEKLCAILENKKIIEALQSAGQINEFSPATLSMAKKTVANFIDKGISAL